MPQIVWSERDAKPRWQPDPPSPQDVRARIAAANSLSNVLSAIDRAARLLEPDDDETFEPERRATVSDLNISALEIERLLGSEDEQ